jgi:hypothetical protein
LLYLHLIDFTVHIVRVGDHFAGQLLDELEVVVVQLEAVDLLGVHLVILQEVVGQCPGQDVVVVYFGLAGQFDDQSVFVEYHVIAAGETLHSDHSCFEERSG